MPSCTCNRDFAGCELRDYDPDAFPDHGEWPSSIAIGRDLHCDCWADQSACCYCGLGRCDQQWWLQEARELDAAVTEDRWIFVACGERSSAIDGASGRFSEHVRR
jgi:hypothetical protein